MKAGKSVDTSLEAAHRVGIFDAGENLICIEVQRGTYFGEDDILRLENDFGRN